MRQTWNQSRQVSVTGETLISSGMHRLLRQNQSSGKEIQYVLEIITCALHIYL